MNPNNNNKATAGAATMESQQNLTGNPDNLTETFMEITSSTAEEAQFFLESHNFDLDAAVSTFLESTSTATPAPTADFNLSPSATPSPPASVSPSSSPSRSRSHSPPAANSRPRSQYNLRSRRPSISSNDGGDDTNTRRSNSGHGLVGGIRTLADLNRGDGSGSGSDRDRPPQYFTGGEKSGMLVQDPSEDNNIDAIFEQARRMGAIEGPADVYRPSSSSRSFTGTARLLSGEMVSSAQEEQPPEVVTHIITFWRNGFTVDDGPLRSFDDQANASFLESIKNSECPKELEPANRRTAVNVNLVRRDENCPEQPKCQIPFQGVGRTLSANSSTPSEPMAAATALNTAPSPVMGLVVDEKLPSTSIQIRLADGTRMVSRFNYHHSIRDIHAFIDSSRPGRAGSYTLQTVGFPPKQLADLDQTIEQAGLANSVVIQKL